MRNRLGSTATATQQQIKLLAASNACLRRNLIRFSHGLRQVGQLAYHDDLTGLPNRYLMLDRLQQAMQQAARQQKQVLLLLIDLDRFKTINDELGYSAGDSLLQQMALRLTSRIRGADTACRYGGDEFVIMMPEIEGPESAVAAVVKIREQLAAPYLVEGRTIHITASVGAALYQGDKQTLDSLVRQAETDLHQSKAISKKPIISPL